VGIPAGYHHVGKWGFGHGTDKGTTHSEFHGRTLGKINVNAFESGLVDLDIELRGLRILEICGSRPLTTSRRAPKAASIAGMMRKTRAEGG